jgi:methyl-accepting chemotaxis protein
MASMKRHVTELPTKKRATLLALVAGALILASIDSFFPFFGEALITAQQIAQRDVADKTVSILKQHHERVQRGELSQDAAYKTAVTEIKAMRDQPVNGGVVSRQLWGFAVYFYPYVLAFGAGLLAVAFRLGMGKRAATVALDVEGKSVLLSSVEVASADEGVKESEPEKTLISNACIRDFEAVLGRITDHIIPVSEELTSAANSLSHSAGATQQLTGMVAASSELTSSNVQSVATTCDQLTDTVQEISQQVQASHEIATEAAEQINSTNTFVMTLSQSAERIGNVVDFINNIATQTNLLALNATIEAAHAGEAGRGFAVVAHEVKELATQTAKATSDIAAQISSMQNATCDAVTSIKAITGTISRMSQIAGVIAAAVEEQTSSTKEISRNAEEAAEGSADVASAINDIVKSTDETGTAASRMQESAKSLSSEGAQLQAELEQFIKRMQVA